MLARNPAMQSLQLVGETMELSEFFSGLSALRWRPCGQSCWIFKGRGFYPWGQPMSQIAWPGIPSL
jgi:hypothetical protein